jgi:hypothetical protein
MFVNERYYLGNVNLILRRKYTCDFMFEERARLVRAGFAGTVPHLGMLHFTLWEM